MVSRQIITFVFSDIEHSTRLAQQSGEKYPEILENHRSIIRKAIHNYQGREIDTAGDGFFMTFQDPYFAVLASQEIQSSFNSESWANRIGLKVRMGIHTGEALSTFSGYTGVEVHYASRICSVAYGGQVLMSEDTVMALGQNIEKISIINLGEYQLKDFLEPVKLFQLNIKGLKNSFPRLSISPQEKRIAVLPFINVDKDEELEYIGEGMADELIVALGKIQGVRVVSRSIAFPLAMADRNPLDIGKKLRISALLEGRIKTEKSGVKISADLINTESGFNIWSGHYDSTRDNLLPIQDDIKHKVAVALGCKVISQQQDSIQKRQTQNAEAYDFYLRGRRFYLQYSNRGISLALQMFQRAIEADRHYALAFAGMADCYIYHYQHIERKSETLNKADQMSKKAIDLAPAFPEVHVSRGIILSERGLFEESEKSFKYAIETDPTLFLGWYQYARSCFVFGKLEKAARLFEQANRVEPEDYQSLLLASQVYDDLGSNELASSLRLRGATLAENCIELNPGDTRALYLAANAFALLKNREKSLLYLQRALALEPEDSMLLYNAGCVYALLNMQEEAMVSLEKAFSAGLTLIGWYENDSNLDSLRRDQRFIDLLEKIRNLPK
ncbi:MAG: hypothetical protein DWQ02_22635 [Bacteroidetes bacterium]|nr:MAG: hypothetical protein DWQ02_22635 [Bacteroidota bacterium]